MVVMRKIAFVCVGNAGRSQLATGLAEREREHRGVDVEIVTGGLEPGEQVYDEVRTALYEVDVDIGDRHPRRIEPGDLADADYVVTIGCSVDEVLPPAFDGEIRTWSIDATGAGLPAVRSQRDTLAEHVGALFDELEASSDSESPR